MKGIAASIFVFLGTIPFSFAQTIPDQIDAILARSAVAANTWSVVVENEDGSVRYYQKNPTTGKAPASNTKMVTTAAAFGLLGTNHVFESRVYLAGTFTNGTLSGNVNLVSEHDMTWNDSTFGSGNADKALQFIAGKLKTNGLNVVNGDVQCYGVCYYDRSSTSTGHNSESATNHNGEAAGVFRAALLAQGITVSGTSVGKSGFSPPGNLFYTYHSTNLTYGGKPLRLDVACIPLMKVSHNVMADELLRHIGYKLSGSDTFSAGRSRVFTWLQNTVGISTNATVLNDGSGLSWNNRFSAQQLISLTRYMLGAFPSWKTTLPIGCTDGTLGGRFCGTDGDGQVFAKTGSLSVSIALSGYIVNPYDNRRYLFSFMGNESGGDIDQTATRDAIDDSVALLGGRGVPIAPELLTVTNKGTGSALTLTWSDEKFIRTGYRIYSSTNAINWGTPISVGSTVHTYTENNVPPNTKRFYRVSVIGSGGESPASRSYGAQTGSQRSRVLVVDGNDRWQMIPAKNPSATNHSFAALAGHSISGPAFDTVHHNMIATGALTLTNYEAVLWLLGEESTQDESFSATEQTLVKNYLDARGNLFISGSEIGWDLDRTNGPTASDRDFYHNQLRALLNGNTNDDANTYAFAPVAGGIFAGNVACGFDNGSFGTYDVTYPDVLTPTNGALAALMYSGGRGGAAAIVYPGTSSQGKIVNFGFPFETITNSAARDAYMSDVLRFFDVLDPPRMLSTVLNPMQNQLTLNWSWSAGLKYRVQSKTSLQQTNWTDLTPDITATNTRTSTNETVGAAQKFYRILLVN